MSGVVKYPIKSEVVLFLTKLTLAESKKLGLKKKKLKKLSLKLPNYSTSGCRMYSATLLKKRPLRGLFSYSPRSTTIAATRSWHDHLKKKPLGGIFF